MEASMLVVSMVLPSPQTRLSLPTDFFDRIGLSSYIHLHYVWQFSSRGFRS